MHNKLPHERYQHKPFPGSSHSWTLKYLDKIPVDAAVLDIGPGSGIMGSHLKDRGLTALTAVEIDPNTREALKYIYPTILADSDELPENSFDLAMLLDVIEHTPTPEVLLKRAFELTAPGGTLLVSVPNIAHWSVRLPLLFGFFDYTDRGILDRTHLQFFTRKRFKHLLNTLPNSNLLELSSSLEPAEFVLPEKIWNSSVYKTLRSAELNIAQILPGFFAYQHLAAVRKEPG